MATAIVPIADVIADRFTARAVSLLRFEAHLRRKALAALRKLERQLVAEIEHFDPLGPTRTAFQQARLDALLRQTRATIATSYRGIDREIGGELEDLAVDEHESVKRVINGTVGASVMSVSVSETQLRQIVGNALIEGSPSKEWWGRQSQNLLRRFSDRMRQGMLRGESIQDLARRVRGTRANGFTDGIMNATRQQAEALVRSSVSAVSNGARLDTYKANGDIIRGVQCHATLDGRTTLICISRSGSAWDLETGKALPESPRQEPFPGPLPWHWGERSVLIPVLKPIAQMLRELGVRKVAQLRALPQGTQASMDGQVAASLDYPTWLKSKPKAFQIEVLGAGRWQLWRAGKLSLTELIHQSGRPRRLEELREAA